MAQVCGGKSHDFQWQYVLEKVLALLRMAADACVAKRLNEIPKAFVLGAVLQPFSDRNSPRMFVKAPFPVSQWQTLGLTAEKVLLQINRKAPVSLIERTAKELERVLFEAVDRWTETGYPEDPTTLFVLNKFVEILGHGRFTKHPPNELFFREKQG